MSEDCAMELIDKIGETIEVLHENYQEKEEIKPTIIESEDIREEPIASQEYEKDEETRETLIDSITPIKVFATESRKGKPWTENEEELITLFFNQGKSIATIAEIVGRTEVAIKSRLGMMGLIDYTYGKDVSNTVSDSNSIHRPIENKKVIELDDYIIENTFMRCALKNKNGDKVFSADGKLILLGEKLYRLNMKKECFTIKDMQFDGSVWMRGQKKIVAYPGSTLYDIMNSEIRYEKLIEEIIDDPVFFECRVKVSGRWYDNNGQLLGGCMEPGSNKLLKSSVDEFNTFIPKGKLRCLENVAEESYDFLLAMAVVEFMQFTPQPTIITFDRLACMMIAVAWEILSNNEEARTKEGELCECIQFLINESKEAMDDVLTWNSSKKDVFNSIKDYPMAGVFEDTVDNMTEDTPYSVLKAWIKSDEKEEIARESNTTSSTCLYGIHALKRNPYIEVKQGWMHYLLKEHDSLMNYFVEQYLDYLEGC